jgi:hypothetical protein
VFLECSKRASGSRQTAIAPVDTSLQLRLCSVGGSRCRAPHGSTAGNALSVRSRSRASRRLGGRPTTDHSVNDPGTVHVGNEPRADDAPVFLALHYRAGRRPNVRGALVLGAQGARNAPTTPDRVPAAPGAVGQLAVFQVSVSEFECRAALGALVEHRRPEGRRL